MLKDVTSVEPLGDHKLRLRFEAGVDGVVDVSALSFRGVFAPLKDPVFFRQVSVDPDLGTIVWPNGADLDPDVLCAQVTGGALLPDRVPG